MPIPTSSTGRHPSCHSCAGQPSEARDTVAARLELVRRKEAGTDGVRLGVVTEAFGERPLDEVLDWLGASAPGISDLELASGGYPPTPHCDRRALLADPAA